MPVFFIVIGVVTLGFLVAMLLGLLDVKPAPDPVRPFGHVPLPEGAYTAEDVDDIRFDAVMRGYKMSEVDEVLDRMQRRQAELEEQVRGLGGNPGTSVGRAGLTEPVRNPAADDGAHLPSSPTASDDVRAYDAPEPAARVTEPHRLGDGIGHEPEGVRDEALTPRDRLRLEHPGE